MDDGWMSCGRGGILCHGEFAREGLSFFCGFFSFFFIWGDGRRGGVVEDLEFGRVGGLYA